MIAFLIKSTISMALLLAVYNLFLEREKMHRFNRFYLLFSIAFSLALPFINIEVYTEVPTVAAIANTTVEQTEVQQIVKASPVTITPVTEGINYTPYLLWGVYAGVAALLLFRFSLNLIRFTKEVKANRKVKYQSALLVLVQQNTVPYTFLQYIFINRDDYINNAVEDELYAHELAHVNQKHTLDILFTEALKIVFWFNPLLYFYKKAIQLNHEFLADEKVVSNLYDALPYQQLLVAKATMGHPFYLASSLNFSVTKKRLQMMTKTTPALRATIKKAALGVVFCGLVFFLCVQTLAQQTPEVIEVSATVQAPNISDARTPKDKRRDQYFAGVKVKIKNYITNTTVDKVYEDLTQEERRNYFETVPVPPPAVKKSPTAKELADLKNKSKYAIWIDGVNVDNSKLNNYKPSDIASFSGSPIFKNARTKQHPQPYQYWLYTHPYFEKNIKNNYKTYGSEQFYMTVYETKTVISPMQMHEEIQQINKSNATVKPQFPGGQAKFDAFFKANFKMPEGITAKGDVAAVFAVETDGTISDIKIQGYPDLHGADLEQEVLRVLKLSPKWLPAQSHGKAVRYSHVLPINVFK